MSYDRLSFNFKHVMLAIDTDHEPKSYEEAYKYFFFGEKL